MDIMEMGASLFKDKLGGDTDSGAIKDALGKLIGDGDKMDLGGMLGKLQSGGLGDLAQSWLGDGDNKEISTDQVKDVIGGDKIKEVAAELGTDEGSLLDGLKDALPQMLDKSSSGGSLLDSLGGLGDLAKKLF